MKIILTARAIPLLSTVTKCGGSKQYIIKDRITIYDKANGKKELLATNDSFLLISDNGDATSIGGNTELIWLVSENELFDYLNEMLEETN